MVGDGAVTVLAGLAAATFIFLQGTYTKYMHKNPPYSSQMRTLQTQLRIRMISTRNTELAADKPQVDTLSNAFAKEPPSFTL